ncbi:MAG: hypothetical protein IKT52_03520, partial [Oscillospiraceae bacterium]|nr:hypothetical protein [Oscillospiraceae bacterium]
LLIFRCKAFDPYRDPYGDSTGWTRQFVTDNDLRVFLEKGLKVVVPHRKTPILAAHNPEVVGSEHSRIMQLDVS